MRKKLSLEINNFQTIPRIKSAVMSAKSIPLSELMKIREKITNENYNQDQENKLKSRKQLQQNLQEKIQNWPNTLQALRKKKGDARFERFKIDEEERRRVDEEEKHLQQIERKNQLQRANNLIYEQNDRVKSFQTKLLQSDALQELEEQKIINEQLKQMDKVRDIMFTEMRKEQAIEEDKAEQKIKKALELKKQINAQILLEQKNLMRDNFMKKIQEEKIEGEIIKERAIFMLQKEKEESIKRKNLEIQNRQFIQLHNEQIKLQKEMMKIKDKEDEEKINKHAQTKAKVNEIRKIREQTLFNQKQMEKQRMIDEQTRKIQEEQEKQNLILNKNIKEREIKEEQAELIKKQKMQQMKDRINQSHTQALKKARIQSAMVRTEQDQYQHFCLDKNEKGLQKEYEEKQQLIKRAKDLKEYHLTQVEQKQKVREEEYLREFEEARRLAQVREEQDQDFNQYAQRMIAQWKEEGKDIRPLLKQLKKLQ